MRLVWGDDLNVAQWAANRVGHMRGGFGPCVGIGIVSHTGEAIGAVVYSNYHPDYRSIEISFATANPRCLTKNIIRQIMRYPFEEIDCQRVTAITARKAPSARRFLEHFGFRREGVIRKGLGDDDAVVYGLLKTDWLASPYCSGHYAVPDRKWHPLPKRHEASALH